MPEISDEEFAEAKSAVHERLLKLRCSVNEEIRIGYTPRALIGFFFAYVALDSYLTNDFGWIFSLTFKSALFWFFGYIVIDLFHHHFMSTLEYEIEEQWISDDNIRRRILKAYDDEQKTQKFAQYESAESSAMRRVSSGKSRTYRKRTR